MCQYEECTQTTWDAIKEIGTVTDASLFRLIGLHSAPFSANQSKEASTAQRNSNDSVQTFGGKVK